MVNKDVAGAEGLRSLRFLEGHGLDCGLQGLLDTLGKGLLVPLELLGGTHSLLLTQVHDVVKGRNELLLLFFLLLLRAESRGRELVTHGLQLEGVVRDLAILQLALVREALVGLVLVDLGRVLVLGFTHEPGGSKRVRLLLLVRVVSATLLHISARSRSVESVLLAEIRLSVEALGTERPFLETAVLVFLGRSYALHLSLRLLGHNLLVWRAEEGVALSVNVCNRTRRVGAHRG